MIKQFKAPNQQVHVRRGVTLTEVLMSMLIMSIGVSFVAAVFPISVLRSIQASQLTSGTIHRFQAEAMIAMNPDLIHNPDGIPLNGLDGIPGNGDDRANTYREHFGQNYVIDPYGYLTHMINGDTALGSPNAPYVGTFGVDFNGVGWTPRFDGGVIATNPVPGSVAPADWVPHLERISALLAASNDPWEEEVNSEEFVLESTGAGAPIGITFDASVDLTMIPDPASVNPDSIPSKEIARIVIFDEHGHESQAYPITRVVGQTVYWTEDFNDNGTLDAGEDLNSNGALDQRNLPSRFFHDSAWEVGHATIELSQLRQYSWMMSVRKSFDGTANVDVAILFNRGVDPDQEHAYRATFVAGEGLVGIEFDDTSEPPPFIKKGGYVFDAEKCRWYRVQDFRESPPEYPNYEFVLNVEEVITSGSGEDSEFLNQALDPAEDANGNGVLDPGEDRDGDGQLDPAEADLNGDGALNFGRAIFLPGVIEVYPLGTIPVPEAI